ncbi:MAG: cobalt ECF transporter T component CbiQ [Deltaproteobacteria bacterium]|nr:cobalt ECF transporter T component CbiQ [Deltaproteobacteria bacterium]
MSSFDSALLDLGRLDSLSYGDTAIHRLDPRAKLVVTLAFIVTVVSFPKYTVAGLIPFFSFPIVMVSMADLPLGFLARKLVLVSPFALVIGIFNPFLDREVLVRLGPLAVTGGWVSFASVMIRFVLTVGAALILVATTSFPGVCSALDRLRVPRLFVVQLMFLYRFIFVLTEEALRMTRAVAVRSFGGKGPGLRLFVQILGVLFLRTMGRAERVYQAMGNRGFDGEIRTLRRLTFAGGDAAFLLVWFCLFAVLRLYNISEIFGAFALRAFG